MSGEQQLNRIETGSAKLEELRAKRRALSPDLYTDLKGSQETFAKLGQEGMSDEQVQKELSKLDKSLADAKQFKGTIADLTAGLTGELQLYTQFVNETPNYQGLEKLMSKISIFGLRERADRKRDLRLKEQTPEENLEVVLKYGRRLVSEIEEVRAYAQTNLDGLTASTDVVVRKIAEYQPIEDGLKQKLDAMQEQYDLKLQEYDNADDISRAQMIEEMNKYRQDLAVVKNDHAQALVVYNQAKDALKANEKSRAAFEQMVINLGEQATMIEEKIEGFMALYKGAPAAVRVAMTTKGMATIDKAMNVAAEQSLDTIVSMAEGVADETLTREEIHAIPPEKVAEIDKRMIDLANDITKRVGAIRDYARASDSVRYPSAQQ